MHTTTTRPERTLDGLAVAMIERLDDEYELIHVERGDALTDEQAAMVARGDWSDLWDSIENWECDARWEGVQYVLDDVLGDVIREWLDAARDDVEREWIEELREDFLGSDAADAVREAITERDSGQWIDHLIDNYGTVFIRVLLGDDVTLTEDDENDVTAIVQSFHDDAMRTDEIVRLVRDMVPETYHYATPFLFGSVDLMTLYRTPKDGRVTLTGGALLLQDVWNGAGHEAALPGEFTVTVNAASVALDGDAPGYSWDETCGLIRGCYPVEIVSEY